MSLLATVICNKLLATTTTCRKSNDSDNTQFSHQ